MIRSRCGKSVVRLLAILIVASASLATTAGATARGYKVGASGESGDLIFTVYGYQDPYTPTNDFFSADPGKHYVVVDVEVKNPSKDQKSFSSLLGFHLVDKQNKQYDETIVPGLDPGPPDGQIPGKSAIRGNVAFEIPDTSALPLKFRAQGSLTASGAYWKLKPPKTPAP